MLHIRIFRTATTPTTDRPIFSGSTFIDTPGTTWAEHEAFPPFVTPVLHVTDLATSEIRLHPGTAETQLRAPKGDEKVVKFPRFIQEEVAFAAFAGTFIFFLFAMNAESIFSF